jgi:hypothetical protein
MDDRWRDWADDQGSKKWSDLHKIGPGKRFVVTASMVPNILGFGFVSRNKVYKAWLGLDNIPEPNYYMRNAATWGLQHEKDAAEMFANGFPSGAIEMMNPGLIWSAEYNWMGASLDRIVTLNHDNGKYYFNLECKCPFISTVPKSVDEVPDRAYLQVQYQMYCTDMSVSVLVFWSTDVTTMWLIERDDMLIQQIIHELVRFKRAVEKQKLPKKGIKKTMKDYLQQSRSVHLKPLPDLQSAAFIDVVVNSKYQPQFPEKTQEQDTEEVDHTYSDVGFSKQLIQDVIRFKTTGQLPDGNYWQQRRFRKRFDNDFWTVVKDEETGNLYLFCLVKVRKVGNEYEWAWKPVIDKEEALNRLQAAYQNDEQYANSIMKLYKRVGGDSVGITRRMVKRFLQNHEAYQLHRRYYRMKIIKPVVVDEPLKYFQADLIDLGEKLPYKNRRYRYCLTIVDVCSKYAWVYPLKVHNAEAMLEKYEEWILELEGLESVLTDAARNRQKIIQTDNGGEFIAAVVKEFFKKHGFQQRFSRSHTPQTNGAIERFNQTLKRMIYAHFTRHRTLDWISILDTLVRNYNSSWHSSIRDTPQNVLNSWLTLKSRDNPESEELSQAEKEYGNALSVLHNMHSKTLEKINRIKQEDLNVGDYCRISLAAIYPDIRKQKKSRIGAWSKGYVQRWTNGIYQVVQKLEANGLYIFRVKEYDKVKDKVPFSNKINLNNWWFKQSDLQKISVDKLVRVQNTNNAPIQEVLLKQEEPEEQLLPKKGVYHLRSRKVNMEEDDEISDMPVLGGPRQRIQATPEEEAQLQQEKKQEDELNKATDDSWSEHVDEEQQQNAGIPNEDIAGEEEHIAKQQRELHKRIKRIKNVPNKPSLSRQFREAEERGRREARVRRK